MQTSNFYNGCSFIFIISDNLTARYKLQFVSFQMTGETPDKHFFIFLLADCITVTVTTEADCDLILSYGMARRFTCLYTKITHFFQLCTKHIYWYELGGFQIVSVLYKAM